MKSYFFLICLCLLMSCTNTAVEQELKKAQEELASVKATIENLQAQIEPEGKLVHVVFLKLKPDADRAMLISEIKKLAGIEQVKDLEVGPFEDVGDSRALSEYQMMMQMSFDNRTAYETYQAHPIHAALKENTKSMMAGPPATFDFLKE